MSSAAVGNVSLKVIHTPHTLGESLFMQKAMFLLAIPGLWRKPSGELDLTRRLAADADPFDKGKLFALPDDTIVMPGHNYGKRPSSTIGREKKFNPYLK